MLRHLILGTSFLATLGGVGTGALWASIQVDDATLPGLRVGGEELAPTSTPSVEIRQRAEAWLDAPITIRAPGASREITTTRRRLGTTVDATGAAREALALGRSGDVVADLTDWWRASRGEIDITPEPQLSRDALGQVVALFHQHVERRPVPGRVDFDARVAEPHVDGATLDVLASVDALATAVLGGGTAELVVRPVLVDDAHRIPDGLSFDSVIASFRTRYHSWGKNHSRAHNVELATQRLHGAIIPAGGTLSFNARVGERTRRAGFRRAKVISGGELVDGMGGGVCQVASTLHAAAQYAGMEMVAYRPHSRPSGYIPMGLDATVVWPTQDLEIKNPFEFAVAVYATAEEGDLSVELIGAEDPREVEIERRVLGRRAFEERVVEDPSLEVGTRVVSQEGIRGARVERVRIVQQGDERFADYDIVTYPPTDRIVRVGTAPLAATTLSREPIGPVALR